MTCHILTHNSYAITSLVVLTIGSFYVCNQVQNRWFAQLKFTLMDTNALIKSLTVVLGFNIISWQDLFDASYPIQAIGTCIGIICGFLFAEIEKYILRCSPTTAPIIIMPNRTDQCIVKNNLLRIKPINSTHTVASYHSAAIVGACEEILYRGFLTVLSIELLDIYLSIFCLLILTLLFALSHLSLGPTHVLSKFILGLLCLISFLYTKSVMTPILIHTTFNIIAIKKLRKHTNA